jgi:uncharacterized membrane protein YozB (DUF420 family)
MSAPWQALLAVGWAIVGPPLIVYAAAQVRRGRVGRHAVLLGAAACIELFVVLSFGRIASPHPRRALLEALPVFTIHLAFAYATLAGIAWQLGSRAVPRLRGLHRHTGPYVALVWVLALVTGIYNFVFIYLL